MVRVSRCCRNTWWMCTSERVRSFASATLDGTQAGRTTCNGQQTARLRLLCAGLQTGARRLLNQRPARAIRRPGALNWPALSSPRCMRIGGVVALLFLAGAVEAQADYPINPVQLIAQQPPGSQSEAISRIWAECASRGLGQPVIVVSKPGANGVVATNHLKLQRADGYTIMTVGMSQMTITPYVYKNLPYDPRRDFNVLPYWAHLPCCSWPARKAGSMICVTSWGW